MSDKTYWLNKHVKRQYAKSDFLRADGGRAPSWMSTVTVIAVALLIFGVMQFVTGGFDNLIGIIMTAVGGVVTVGTIAFSKIKDTTAHSEFILKYKDQELIFQYIGKKHIVFACGDKIFEFKNKEVKKVDTLYRPYATMNAIAEVLYDSKTRKGENVTYFGESEGEENGKKVTYKYKVKLGKDNRLETFTVNGDEMTFYLLKKGEQKLALPINLYNEIRSAGIELPGDDIITLVYNY